MDLPSYLRSEGYDDLAQSLETIERNVTAHWSNHNMWWFTITVPKHSRRVAECADKLATMRAMPADVELTPIERYVLSAAAWVHDIGMQPVEGPIGPADADRVRRNHPALTREMIIDRDFELGLPQSDKFAVETIAILAGSHGTHYYKPSVSELAPTRTIRGTEVRVALLAAILLYADELDLRDERLPDLAGRATLDSLSQAHWLKHECVNDVQPVLSDTGQIAIEIVMLRAPNLTIDDARDIERWIVLKLQEQLVLVSEQIKDGFNGYVEISNRIRVRWNPVNMAHVHWSESAMAHIRADVSRYDLINHRDCLAQAVGAVETGSSTRIIAALGPERLDVMGREDVFLASVATLRADAFYVIDSPPPDPDYGSLVASDVLSGLAASAGIDGIRIVDDEAESRSILSAAMEKWLAEQDVMVVLAIPGLDALPPRDRRWLCGWLAEQTQPGRNVAAIVTDASAREDLPASWVPVMVGNPPVEIVRDYVSRYYPRHVSRTLVSAESTYAEAKGHAAKAIKAFVDAP